MKHLVVTAFKTKRWLTCFGSGAGRRKKGVPQRQEILVTGLQTVSVQATTQCLCPQFLLTPWYLEPSLKWMNKWPCISNPLLTPLPWRPCFTELLTSPQNPNKVDQKRYQQWTHPKIPGTQVFNIDLKYVFETLFLPAF